MLKKQLNAEVHFLTKSAYVSLLKNNPYIDSVYQIDASINEVIGDLKKENYDYVIDLHNNLRTQILKFKLGVPSRSFNKLNMEKFMLTTFKMDSIPKVHIVDRYLDTVLHLGIKNDNEGLDFFLSAKDEVDVSCFPNNYTAFVIGGQHATKILPTKKIISIIKNIDKPVLLIGGPEDGYRGEEIAKACDKVVNTCGKYSVLASASLIKQAEMVITHDTGMMHIAAAFGQKIYSVWGNTVPEFGMYPYKASASSKRIEVQNLSCRPCSKIGYSKCPKGHFKCMQEIDENLFLSE
jgi:ADP-heptose:LPS heptosyltransferase